MNKEKYGKRINEFWGKCHFDTKEEDNIVVIEAVILKK
jgi:hypothetical protein